MIKTLFAIVGFGVIGVLSRFVIHVGAYRIFQSHLPLGTFIVNVLGGFLAGAFYVYTQKHEVPEAVITGILIGFLGGFTTFSSYSLETFKLVEQGHTAAALGYFILSPLTAFLGLMIGARILSSV